jgi:hypothetical protein
MAEILLTQVEADALIAMDKFLTDDTQWNYPRAGEQLSVPLTSSDRREIFALDIMRSRIKAHEINAPEPGPAGNRLDPA